MRKLRVDDPYKETKGWLLVLCGAIFAFMMSCSTPAEAQSSDWLSINWTSYHFDRKKGYNEENLGVLWEHKYNEEFRTGIGYIDKNSFGRHSTLVYGAWTPGDFWGSRWGGVFGFSTGYKEDTVVPLVGIYGTKEWKDVGINVQINPAVFLLQIKGRFR